MVDSHSTERAGDAKVERLRENIKDVDASGAVAEIHYTRLLRFLSVRLSDKEEARDLAQEAYLRLLRASEARLIEDPVAYLFRIARNLLSEWYRSLPPPMEPLEWNELTDNGSSVEDLAAFSQYLERLGEVLEHLPPKCRAAILMHRRDGMTYAEIATVLGISSSMVKKYLRQGLTHCRVRMRRYYES